MHTKLPRTLEKINAFHLMFSLGLMKRLRNYYTMLRMILVMSIPTVNQCGRKHCSKAVDELNYCCVNKLKTEDVASASEYKLKLSLIIYYL